MALEDAGPAGADAGKGGKYLIVPPGYSKPVPKGYIVLRSTTFGGYALLRSNLKTHSDADVAKSVAYAKRVKVYPLSKAASPPPTVFSDAADVVFDSTIRYDASFFTSLNRVVQNEPWLSRDRAMIDTVADARYREGQALQPGRQDKGRAGNRYPRSAGVAGSAILHRPSELLPGHPMELLASPEMVAAIQKDFNDPIDTP